MFVKKKNNFNLDTFNWITNERILQVDDKIKDHEMYLIFDYLLITSGHSYIYSSGLVKLLSVCLASYFSVKVW